MPAQSAARKGLFSGGAAATIRLVTRALSSAGQSGRLIIFWSQVQVLQGPPPKTFRRFSYDSPRFWKIREQHRRCGIDKRGGRIMGEVRDGHGRGGRISEHEKRREGRGWHGAFGFGACGTAAAPRFGNAGWISGGAPPQERGAKRPEDRAWRSLCSHGALRTQTARSGNEIRFECAKPR